MIFSIIQTFTPKQKKTTTKGTSCCVLLYVIKPYAPTVLFRLSRPAFPDYRQISFCRRITTPNSQVHDLCTYDVAGTNIYIYIYSYFRAARVNEFGAAFDRKSGSSKPKGGEWYRYLCKYEVSYLCGYCLSNESRTESLCQDKNKELMNFRVKYLQVPQVQWPRAEEAI